MRSLSGLVMCGVVIAALGAACEKATCRRTERDGEGDHPRREGEGAAVGVRRVFIRRLRGLAFDDDLPYPESEKAETQELMVDLFSIAMPEIISDVGAEAEGEDEGAAEIAAF